LFLFKKIKTIYVFILFCRGDAGMNFENFDFIEEMKFQKERIRMLRRTLNCLTDDVVVYINKLKSVN